MANYNTTATTQGLTTYTVTAPTTDIYVVDIKTTFPTLTSSGGTQQSALVTTVNQNGSPVATYSVSRGSQTRIAATAGDTISVVFSSSSAVDQAINSIKSTIAISEGVGA
jgi:hypothetical protein